MQGGILPVVSTPASLRPEQAASYSQAVNTGRLRLSADIAGERCEFGRFNPITNFGEPYQ